MESCQLRKIISKTFFRKCKAKTFGKAKDFLHHSLLGHYLHLYTEKKRWAHFQRTLFMALAFLFFVCGMIIYAKTVINPFGFYFEHFLLLKQSINGLCFMLSVAAGLTAWVIEPEKEAREYIIQKVEQIMNPSSQEEIIFADHAIDEDSTFLLEENLAQDRTRTYTP